MVKFPRSRQVFVDDQKVGRTNQLLLLETGTHKFALGPPQNYKPLRIVKGIAGTSPVQPLVIVFEPT